MGGSDEDRSMGALMGDASVQEGNWWGHKCGKGDSDGRHKGGVALMGTQVHRGATDVGHICGDSDVGHKCAGGL